MKIRQGFVTNSSSTSYTIVIEKDYFDEILKDVHPYVQAVFKALAKESPVQTFLGKQVISLGWVRGNDDSLEYLDIDYDDPHADIDDDEDRPDADEWEEGHPNAYEATDKFMEKLTDKNRYLESSVEC